MSYAAVVRLPLMVLLVASFALAAPKKKKVVVPPKSAANIATEVAIKKTLDGVEEKVGGCVLDHAGPAAFTLVVKAKIAINSAGQLMGTTLTTTPESPASEKTRKCIDGVLQTLAWPKSAAPMVNAEREWTFSTESK
ncbi:MAG: hypothetical protein Q8L48_31755 [Archangium sp.]|nr:hypothetical protein [Archangium sp.]